MEDLVLTIVSMLIYASVISAITWALMWPYTDKFTEAHASESKVGLARTILAFWFILIAVATLVISLGQLAGFALRMTV